MRNPNKMKSKTAPAFTVIELLVALVTVVILVTLLLPALGRAKEKATRSRCLNNIRQLDLGLLAYGHDNGERLPRMTADNWVWDLPLAAADTLKTNGVTRNMMYDPGHPEQDSDAFWNYGLSIARPYHVIGYAMTFRGTGLDPKKQNFHIYPEACQCGGISLEVPENSTRRVLAAGVVISQSGETNTNQLAAYHWKDIPNPYGKPVRSSHLDRAGKLPLGDNVAMLDGSGRWVKFSDMKPRTQSGPVFWW
jgi:type II secretory pathway pseudopilin PulG